MQLIGAVDEPYGAAPAVGLVRCRDAEGDWAYDACAVSADDYNELECSFQLPAFVYNHCKQPLLDNSHCIAYHVEKEWMSCAAAMHICWPGGYGESPASAGTNVPA